jgi:hypothetical protein
MTQAALPVSAAEAVERLRKLRRLLRDLKVTEEYLRQYPGLAEKVALLLESARAAGGER